MKQPSNIYDSSTIFFIILKIIGLAPYQLDKRDFSLKMNCWNYLLFIFQLILWIYYSWRITNYFQNELFQSYANSKIMDHAIRYLYILQFYLMVLAMIYSFLKRKHVEKFLKLIFKFDLMVKELGWSHEVVHSKYFVLVISLSYGIFVILFNYFTYFVFNVNPYINNAKTTYSITAYLFLSQFFLMVSMQFIFGCNCICSRFSMLLKNCEYLNDQIFKYLKFIYIHIF